MAPRLPSRVARVATLAVPDAGGPAQLGVVASGTGGAAAVVAAVVDRFRAREVAVLRVCGRRLEGDDAFGAVRDLVSAGAAAAPEDERIVRDAVLGRSRMLVALGPLDESEVGELAAIVLDTAVDDQLVDAVHDLTGGMPDLVELLLAAWADTGTIKGGRLTGPPPPPTPSLVAALRARVDELAPATRTVLEALSAGADLDDQLLSATTDIAPDRLGDAIDDLHAAGLVAPGTGDVVPLVAAATESPPGSGPRR